MSVLRLSCNFFAVAGQLYAARAVGVYLYRGASARAVFKALARNVNERLLAPICLVYVKAVFSGLAVKGYKSLVVSRIVAMSLCEPWSCQ